MPMNLSPRLQTLLRPLQREKKEDFASRGTQTIHPLVRLEKVDPDQEMVVLLLAKVDSNPEVKDMHPAKVAISLEERVIHPEKVDTSPGPKDTLPVKVATSPGLKDIHHAKVDMLLVREDTSPGLKDTTPDVVTANLGRPEDAPEALMESPVVEGHHTVAPPLERDTSQLSTEQHIRLSRKCK